MKLPSLNCKIELFCPVNPSEDPNKVELAIKNIIPHCKIKTEKFSIIGISNDLQSLEKIQDNIRSMRSQRIYQRTMEKNSRHNSTWFYLNKQAAWAEKIALCEEPDESPLGPIKVVLTSTSIDRIIEWLVYDEE